METVTASATADSPTSEGGSVAPLGQDRVVRGIFVALVLASLPVLTPILSEPWRARYSSTILEILFLTAVLVAIRYRLRSVEEPRKRRFWNLLALSFATWLVMIVVHIITPEQDTPASTIDQLIQNGPYFMMYVGLIGALEIHPHVRHDSITYPLRVLDLAGSFVVLLGMMAYFHVLPTLPGSDWGLGVSLFTLYATFDTYLILRLWFLRVSATTREWRTIYSWLLAGVTLWGIGDFLLAIGVEGLLADSSLGTPLSLIWPMALSAVVVATRVTADPRDDSTKCGPTRQGIGIGPLVGYALLPLVVHTTFYRFGSPDPVLRAPREILALAITTILGGMALAYQRLLRQENRRLAREEATAREQLVHQAFYDDLTGLPNRNLFRDRLQQTIEDSIRYGRKCGVMFCDLDQFKVINDSLGHDAGDLALIAIAERLRASSRKQDTVARFGGDEFAFICPGMHHALDAALLAEKFLTVVREPLVVGDKVHALSASVGIAVFPDDGEDAEALLKHADTAMYQAKLHGRNSYRLFTEAMNEAAEERLAVEQGLRSGLIENRFAVFYQPIVALSSGQPAAYEALLRWKHPERGYISPVNFIDVAEQTGLILPIGKWVLETACAWATDLEAAAGGAPSISVNISPRQLRDTRLADDVGEVLENTGLDPNRLQLEITESMALTDDFTATPLHELRELGVRIAIDDFGTGYAALSRLQELPVDIVKIDGSFVQGVESGSVNEAIVQAIVDMARALDFYVVAEGVETELELDVVRQSRCDAAQGFYLCDPLSPEDLREKYGGFNA